MRIVLGGFAQMISGHLSPEGIFYNAPYWSHLNTAQRIVEDNGWFSDNKKDYPEDILLKRGFICIRSRDMYKRSRNDQGTILGITDAQQNWLQDRGAELNLNQRKDCKDMIETFGGPFRFAKKVLNNT